VVPEPVVVVPEPVVVVPDHEIAGLIRLLGACWSKSDQDRQQGGAVIM